jgi:thiamine biosynthesis lipoprotein
MKFFLSILLLLCLGCSEKIPTAGTTSFSGIAMTIEYRLVIGNTLTQEQSEKIQQIITSTFEEINAVYNNWNPQSELSKLNQLGADQKIAITPELEGLLKLADQLVHLTEGKFDPTIAPLQNLWKTKLAQGLTPSDDEILSAAKATGWNKIHFEKGFFWKDEAKTALDLGGIAKGYAVDIIIDRVQNIGYQNVFFEWGGEIRAIGQHPAHRPWKVFITKLGDTDPAHAVATVTLENQALATSGDYMQNWTVHSQNRQITYFHIINPATYRPLEITPKSIASASTLAPTCAFADALATAAMLFETPEEANKWIAKIQDKYPAIQFWLFTRE